MLSNRGPVLGYATPAQLVYLGVAAEQSGVFDFVWSGDAFMVNPRLDAITLLASVAAQTKTIQLGPACMGSFTQRNALDLAYSWASLDCIADGRTVMVACVGGGNGPAWDNEGAATGIPSAHRRDVMWERIALLRRLWQEDAVCFEGDYHNYTNVTISPRPVRQPYPIWTATNVTRLASGKAAGKLPTKTLGQVGRSCDGWMTHSLDPATFDDAWHHIGAAAAEHGKDATSLDNCLVFNVCIDDNAERALDESVAFLADYYGIRFTRERTEAWTAFGSPEQCAARLRSYRESSVKRIALRLTSRDQIGQFERLVNEVLPLV